MTPPGGTDVVARIRRIGLVEAENGCWLFQGATNSSGYGIVRTGRPDKQTTRVHRAMYEAIRGLIPEGLVLDHLCRVPMCCNPDHLEPVTDRTNILRGESPSAFHARRTHCPQGHPYDEANTYVTPAGARNCRECGRARCRAAYRRRQAAALEANGHVNTPRHHARLDARDSEGPRP
jgi:hypothetical protein